MENAIQSIRYCSDSFGFAVHDYVNNLRSYMDTLWRNKSRIYLMTVRYTYGNVKWGYHMVLFVYNL